MPRCKVVPRRQIKNRARDFWFLVRVLYPKELDRAWEEPRMFHCRMLTRLGCMAGEREVHSIPRSKLPFYTNKASRLHMCYEKDLHASGKIQ